MVVRSDHGLPLTATAEGASAWDAFLERYLTFRSGDLAELDRAVDIDPSFAVARAARALLARLQGREEVDPVAEMAVVMTQRPDSGWERSFVALAEGTVASGQWVTLDGWRRHHLDHPQDLFSLSLVQAFVTKAALVEGPQLALEHSRLAVDSVGEHPMPLGFIAMMVVDMGDIDQAHAYAERSLAADASGFTGGHPLIHVYFETGDHQAGADWLDSWIPETDQNSDVLGHLVWHSALHHLELGNHDLALQRYLDCSSVDQRNAIIDGPSLLWRCQMAGLLSRADDPAEPPLALRVDPFLDDAPTLFVGVHVALALAASGDLQALSRLAERAGGFSAPGAAELIPDLAWGLAKFVEGEHSEAADRLLAREPDFGRFGGSHAQAEVWEDILIETLIRAGRLEEAGIRLRARLDRRPSGRDRVLLNRAG